MRRELRLLAVGRVGAWGAATLRSPEQRVSPESGLVLDGARPQIQPAFSGSDPRRTNEPPVIKQFEETSYYLKDVAFVSATTGWAVGAPHWNQAAKKYKGTIIKTTDGGDTWTAQEAGVLEAFSSLHFVDAGRGWVVGTGGTVLQTSDGGARWARRPIPVNEEVHGVFFSDANAGWVSSARPVHHYSFSEEFDDWKASMWNTRDGGQTWVRQTLPESASLINRIDFVDSNTGWAAGTKLTGYEFSRPQHVGVVYQTTDGGRTWRELYATADGFTFTAMDFVDASTGWISGFAHSSRYEGESTFRTSDGGATWQPQKAGSFFTQVRDLQFADRNRGYAVGTAYLGDGSAVWRTLDGGTTWTGIRMEKSNLLIARGTWGLAVAGDRVVVVGDRDYLARSTKAWDSCGTLMTCGSGCACLFTQSLINANYTFHDVFFADELNGWAVGSRTFAPNLWGQVIFNTQDGGATWKKQYEHAPGSDLLFSFHRLDTVQFVDRRNGWAMGTTEMYYQNGRKNRGAIVHTSDGGATWTEQGTDLYQDRSVEFSAAQFLDSQNGWALCSRCGGFQNITLARTSDGGRRWTWVDTGIKASVAVGFAVVQGAMFFSGPTNGWVGAWDTLVSTEDSGSRWTNATLDCGSPKCYITAEALSFADSRNGWVAGQGLYRSVDGGKKWSPAIARKSYHNVQFVNPQKGWLAGDSGELRRTVDGGEHWTEVPTGVGIPLLGLHFVSAERGWIAGDFGVILSYSGNRLPAGKPAVFSVVNGASFEPGIAPSTWITITGSNLAAGTRTWNGSDFVDNRLPTQLNGVQVYINGRPGYPYYVSPTQINVLAPAVDAEGSVPIEVITPQGRSDPAMAAGNPYSPGLFTFSPEGGRFAIAHAADGTWIGNCRISTPLGLGGKMRGARPGETIVVYCTGLGPTSPRVPPDEVVTQPAPLARPVTLYFGRTVAEVVYAGLIGSGLYQINFKVPDVADGDHVIVAEVGGYRSRDSTLISVQR